jgi:mannose-6-phosphate isomerase-like protein (cupin superfamily)
MYRSKCRYNYNSYGCPYYNYAQMMNVSDNTGMNLADYGPYPLVIDIDYAADINNNFRSALWTGEYLQLTLMSIPVGGEIGLEMHTDVDQILRIEEGEGLAMMGADKNNMDYRERVYDDFVIIIPAGTWHNLINTGDEPIKLFSVYAPPQHPHGTIHVTKEDSDKAEY